MQKKILINLPDFRSDNHDNQSPTELVTVGTDASPGLKTLRELAIFRFTCRKCTDAPCISVCPAHALEKNTDGVIDRAINLCVSCKSCVGSCPFGTLMTYFLRFKKDRNEMVDLNDHASVQGFIKEVSPATIELTEQKENPEKRIFRLNDKVLVREYVWESD